MTTMTAHRKSHSIQDYPEHLNPFHEEDSHNRIRFWTLGRKLSRSNSITFSGIKDLKNSWAFRSFMKKGKKSQNVDKSTNNNAKEENSPIIYRRAMQYSSMSQARAQSTQASPERYVYGGSITPLPRSRFQERLRSNSNYEINSNNATPRMARSEVTGSRLSVGSTNPFDEEEQGPVPPVRSRRKKKRAPLPPSAGPVLDVSVTSDQSELHIDELNDSKLSNHDVGIEIEGANFNVELKIVEDEDLKVNGEDTLTKDEVQIHTEDTQPSNADVDHSNINCDAKCEKSDSDDDLLSKASFDKVDIVKYRRNSSVNEDDIRLRRGNLDDYHAVTTKRSKSLTNALNSSHTTTYDINLNEENLTIHDANGNDEPQKVICKLYNEVPRKPSTDTISSTEKEFMEIDKATRELEREISKLNSALHEDDDMDVHTTGARLSVSDIKRRFDNSSPNPIPKPRRSHYGEPPSPINGNGKI